MKFELHHNEVPTPIRPRKRARALVAYLIAALWIFGFAQTPASAQGKQNIRERRDIRHLPRPLKSRLAEIARHPHSFLPITAFSEADTPSQLFQYYLLDTNGFEPNVFTAIIPRDQ